MVSPVNRGYGPLIQGGSLPDGQDLIYVQEALLLSECHEASPESFFLFF